MYTCFLTAIGDTSDRNGLAVGTADDDEQCREPKRRSRAVLKWKIYRRRSVTADVRASIVRCPLALVQTGGPDS